MRRIFRLSLVFGLIVALFFIVGLMAVYLALQQEPQWYAQTIEKVDHQAEEKASDEMLRRAADLTSSLETKGQWLIAFTADQINGWLAVDMPKNHPNMLPKQLTDPRVAIDPNGVTLACRATQASVTTVISLKVDVYLSKGNTVAVRIRKARAGSLPWSLGKVVDGCTKAAHEAKLNMTWRHIDSDPVALIKIPVEQRSGKHQILITTLQLEEGRILVGGITGAKEE
jgi:hypothetical protein